MPSWLDRNTPLDLVLPARSFSLIDSIDYYIVENQKTARAFIKACCLTKRQDLLKISILDKRTQTADLTSLLEPLFLGNSMIVLSEAGAPSIADPGANLILLAHQKNIPVVPLVGPSAIYLALMASGLNGQCFAFHGYLPVDKDVRKKSLQGLEQVSKKHNQAQIFIETPYRNNALFAHMLDVCSARTQLCIAADLTGSQMFIKTMSIDKWRSSTLPDLHKRPVIFILQAF